MTTLKWWRNWFRVNGGYKCAGCGKTRNTLMSIVRHTKQMHTMGRSFSLKLGRKWRVVQCVGR